MTKAKLNKMHRYIRKSIVYFPIIVVRTFYLDPTDPVQSPVRLQGIGTWLIGTYVKSYGLYKSINAENGIWALLVEAAMNK